MIWITIKHILFLPQIRGIIFDYGILKHKYFDVRNATVMAEWQVEQENVSLHKHVDQDKQVK